MAHRIQRRHRTPNIIYARRHPSLVAHSPLYRRMIKFDSAAVDDLTEMVDPYLTEERNASWNIRKKEQVEIFLSYVGTNGHQQLVSQRFGCSQQAVSCIINRVLHAVTDPEMVNHFIRFPIENPQFRRQTAADFSRYAGLPNVLGAVDGTLIPILTPPNSDNEFRCRKGFPALNVSIMVDSWSRILWMNPRYPGSSHDSFVFEYSTARAQLNALNCTLGYAIIGDSGYRNGSRLMTPYAHPATAQEKKFNVMHRKSRVIVEQTIGMMKRRFPILTSQCRVTNPDPAKAARVVLACAVLWNFGLDYGHGAIKQRGRINRDYRIPPSSADARASITSQL